MKLDVSHEAALLADYLCFNGYPADWDCIRDAADQHTGGELDCFQLDMLTDATERAMKARGVALSVEGA